MQEQSEKLFDNALVEVRDISGRLLLKQNFIAGVDIEIPGPAGIYLVTVTQDGVRETIRVVKQ